MTEVNTLITRVRVVGGDQYVQQMRRMASAQSAFTSRAIHVGLHSTAIGLAAIGAAATGLGISSVKAAMEFDSLVRGLTAVMGSAQAAREELKRIEEVAKLPGLGYLEAIEAVTQLMSAGFTSSGAERAIMAFGNALATVGRGKEDFKLVALALTQIATKARVSGEEIKQLSERVSQIRRIMVQAFGTADPEQLEKLGIKPEKFIAGLIAELEKLPRVTGGARNAWDNMTDAITRFRIEVGTGILKVLEPILVAMDDLFNRLVKSGAVAAMTTAWVKLFDAQAAADGLKQAIVGILAVMQAMPVYIRNIGVWAKTHFEPIRNTLAAIAAIAAVMFAGSAITALVQFARGVMVLVGGLARIAASLVTINVLSRQWATVLVALTAGIGAFYLLGAGIGKLSGSIGALKDAFDTGPIASRYRDIMAMLGGTTGSTGQMIQGLAGAGEEAIINPLPGGASVAAQIARNTKATADNTKPLLDFRRHVFGGGDLGQIGVTPVEIAGFGRGRAGHVTIQVYGGDVAAIERTVLDLRRRGLL